VVAFWKSCKLVYVESRGQPKAFNVCVCDSVPVVSAQHESASHASAFGAATSSGASDLGAIDGALPIPPGQDLGHIATNPPC
jgi:hypothetical protein